MSDENNNKEEAKAEAPKEAEAQSDNESGDAESSKKEAAPKGLTLDKGRGGVLGVKAGMTQIFDKEGNSIAVTVIDLAPNKITQVKTMESDGYSAVQVGFIEKKESRTNKCEAGHTKKSKQKGFYHYQEFRLPKGASIDSTSLGEDLTAAFLKEGDLVDLTAVSKGKGFQGAMKRHNFRGLPASHGVSVSHRSHGSTGQRTDPGKVFKGKKMAGHMGHKKVTTQNVKVVGVDLEKNLLLVRGSVPGPRTGIVTVRKAVKLMAVQQ